MKGWSRSLVTPLQRQVAGDTGRPLLSILSAVGAGAADRLLQCRRPFSSDKRDRPRAGVYAAGRAWSGALDAYLRQVLTGSLLLAVMAAAALAPRMLLSRVLRW